MDCSPPGPSAHGILEASILEWVAISFSKGSSRPRGWIYISCIAGGFFTTEYPGLSYAMHENPEKAMAPHSSTFAWKILWMEEPGRLQSMGSLELDTTEQLHFHFSLSCIGEGNGNPLQCSCLENLRDREAWWAAVCGIAQSRTRLKRLSSSSSSMHAWKSISDELSLRCGKENL